MLLVIDFFEQLDRASLNAVRVEYRIACLQDPVARCD